MQIQLKQTEIVAALKQYVQNQGINLIGKQVDITFTAGRKEAGIVADISIEDAGQGIALVGTLAIGPETVAASASVGAKATTPTAMVTVAEQPEVQPEQAPEKAAVSLFN